MQLTRTQIATVCSVCAAIPLAWQHFARTACARQRAAIEAQIAESTRRANALQAEAAKIERAADQARADTANVQLQLDRIQTQLANPAARARYHWDDSSPFARLPKEKLSSVPHLYAMADNRGRLSDQIQKLLQMTESEVDQVQEATRRLLFNYESLESGGIKRAQPTDTELKRHPANEARALDVPYIGSNQMAQLRQDFFGQVTAILGADRANIFINSLGTWMSPTDNNTGNGNPEGIHSSDLRVVFYQPKPGAKTIFATLSSPRGGFTSREFAPDGIPPIYAPYVQDWIAAIRNSPP